MPTQPHPPTEPRKGPAGRRWNAAYNRARQTGDLLTMNCSTKPGPTHGGNPPAPSPASPGRNAPKRPGTSTGAGRRAIRSLRRGSGAPRPAQPRAVLSTQERRCNAQLRLTDTG
jgi:hypothetical protein